MVYILWARKTASLSNRKSTIEVSERAGVSPQSHFFKSLRWPLARPAIMTGAAF